MITLVPMPEEDFQSFKIEFISVYAHDNVCAGHWSASSALALSQEEFRRQLPGGLNTPGHRMYNIYEQQGQLKVGYLWFAELEANGARTGFLCAIHINPEYRGRGYAKAALTLIEEQSVARGLTSVELHVFSHNSAAQALYRSLGYGVTGFNMVKPLRRDEA
jgi:ribosomal protein S18 acetylase RimI-like enzyme